MTHQTPKKTRRRSSVLVVDAGKILGFWAIDPTSKVKYFFVPGGMIEPNESPRQTAIRETSEETGFQISIDDRSEIICQYSFVWDGSEFECETHFFWAELNPKIQKSKFVADASYHQGVDWVSIHEIDSIFSYSIAIKNAVKALLKNQGYRN